MLNLQEQIEKIAKIDSIEQLDAYNNEVLGKSWLLNQEFSKLKSATPEEKKDIGEKISLLKKELQAHYDMKYIELQTIKVNKELENDLVDIGVEAPLADRWFYGLLTKTRREMEQICKEMWFVIEYGHDVVTKYENFEATNIPLSHPATEMHDTIFLNKEDERGEELILRTHTSAMQNGLMKKYGVPLNVVVPWKVYRYEDLDASHDTVFFQLEGMVVDKGISIAHFKDFITKLLSAVFGMEVGIRMRPAYFPFVEPGFEIDATCPICSWKWCALCKKTGWIEILWAGMIHPNVLKEGWIDSDIYSWFAFGIWINRVVAIKYGIKDIRYFTNGDLRFGQSFGG